MTRMMDLIADTRRLAYGSMTDQLVFLAEEAPEGAAELILVGNIEAITPGMVLSSGLNVYYVVGTVPAEKKVLTYPTYDNSLSLPLSVGAPLMVRPRATDWMLFGNLNDVIRAMSSNTFGLYREAEWVLPIDAAWQTYDIPVEAQNMSGMIKVQIRAWGSTDVWVDLPANSVIMDRSANVVRLTRDYATGTDVKFLYRAPFTQATALTDDVVVDLGLAETMIDIPPLGAVTSLLKSTESRRAQTHSQSDPRRATEVQHGSNTAAGRDFSRDFRERCNDEYARLIVRHSSRINV